MAIVGLVGFAGVVVCGLLYIVSFFRGASLKLPTLGMAVFALVIAASVVLPRLELSLPALPFPFPGGEPSQTAQAGPEEDGTEPPAAGGFPQLLLDKRGVVITATELDETGPQGPELWIAIENRSETNVTVELRAACINGWMMDAPFSAAVDAGQWTEAPILFLASKMERSGIEAIAELELAFHILDTNRITFLEPGAVTVRVPAAGAYNSAFDGPGEELYRENGLRAVSGGFSEDGPGLVLFLENTTGQAVTVQVKDVRVNGRRADAVLSEDISAFRRSAALIGLPGASPGAVREISFSLRVRDRDRRTILFDAGPFTIVV